jgi:hypothetical protein
MQRVRLNLCKSGLNAAHRARVHQLEQTRFELWRCIFNTHVRSFARRLFGAVRGRSITKKLNRKTQALCLGISNDSVRSNSIEESVSNCSRDLIVHSFGTRFCFLSQAFCLSNFLKVWGTGFPGAYLIPYAAYSSAMSAFIAFALAMSALPPAVSPFFNLATPRT